ncbi:MAG: RNA polymerase sigma factor [Alphaproteobacteria bacterium]
MDITTQNYPERMVMQEQAPLTQATDEAKDDAELMSRIAGGDQRAFEKLMRRHLVRTARLAQRILGGTQAAEDVAQEAFIRVWKHAGDWEANGAKFTTWLYRIVVNLCIDEKRKRSFANIEAIAEPEDGKDNAEQSMQRAERGLEVRKALEQLPERQRAAFVLCFYEEHSNKDAADILGISVKALESLLVRSRRTLRESLKEEKKP